MSGGLRGTTDDVKTLFLLRHANASAQPGTTDFDRPLTEHGVRTAQLVGATIRALLPDIIIASPARRAQHTAELVKAAARIEKAISVNRRLYEASTSELLDVATDIDDQFASALLVAHNPGLSDLVRVLTGTLETMPPAALAAIVFSIEEWRDMAPGNGRLRDVFRPE